MPVEIGLLKGDTYLGFGFRSETKTNNTTVDVSALNAQLNFSPTNLGVSASVAKVAVTGTTASGALSGSVKAEALTAKVNVGIDPELSKGGLQVFSVGGTANIAKTSVEGSVNIGRVQITAGASTGVGASALVLGGLGRKGFSLGTEFGLAKTFGFSLSATWR